MQHLTHCQSALRLGEGSWQRPLLINDTKSRRAFTSLSVAKMSRWCQPHHPPQIPLAHKKKPHHQQPGKSPDLLLVILDKSCYRVWLVTRLPSWQRCLRGRVGGACTTTDVVTEPLSATASQQYSVEHHQKMIISSRFLANVSSYNYKVPD